MTWVAPRTWVASEVVTAAIMNQHVRDNLLAAQDRIQCVYKPSDQNIISSTVLTNDSALKFTAVAGQNYIVDCNLIVVCASNAADIAIGWSFPAGTLIYSVVGLDTAATSSTASVRTPGANPATSGATVLNLGTPGTTSGVLVRASFKCTTGGTVNLMWTQVTSTASNLTITQGSTLTAIRESI